MYIEFRYKSKKLFEPWKPANPYTLSDILQSSKIWKILKFLWTIIIPIKLPNKKIITLFNLKQSNIVKITNINNIMKVGNFTPNCMPTKIAQMNTKVELFTRLVFVE